MHRGQPASDRVTRQRAGSADRRPTRSAGDRSGRDAGGEGDEYERANRLVEAGRFAEALPLYEAVLARDPDDLNALINLGSALYRCGRTAEAADCYRRVLARDPTAARAHMNLAIVLQAGGAAADAIAHYRAAHRLAPRNTKVLNLLGLCLYESGKLEAAARCFAQALRIDPGSARAANNLAGVYKVQERRGEALALHRRAAEIDPHFFEAHENVGKVHEEEGEIDLAAAAYDRALAIRADPVLALHRALLCPPVFESTEALDDYRRRVTGALAAEEGRRLAIDLARVQSSRAEPPFEWSYHGRDNLSLKRRYAALFADAFPSQLAERRAAAPGPWRIGFVVTPGHEGVFVRCLAGIINRLDRRRFANVLVCSRPSVGILRAAIPAASAAVLEVPLRFDHAIQAIAAARFDVLYHWEVGTDATNYFLPFCRLAPMQCTGWGWPDTSGAPQLDVHLTSASLAPSGAERDFGERLVRLPELPPYFLRPPIPDRDRARTQMELADGTTAYVCAQNLRKIHPDFDPMLGAILRADRRAIALFVEDAYPIHGRLLRERWTRTLGDVMARIRWLPRLRPDQYFALIAAADVLLDTPYFGGANTTYDAFAAGVPVVTLPGEAPRSRYAGAMYAAIGLDAGVATSPQDYVARALALGGDPAHRERIATRLRTDASILFENRAAVTQLEAFFADACLGQR